MQKVTGLLILGTFESKQGRGKTETSGFEFMVGEIGESVEGKSVAWIIIVIIGVLVVLGDKGIVVLEHFEPVQFFFLGRVCFAVFLTPLFEQFGGVRGRQEEKCEKENQRQEL